MFEDQTVAITGASAGIGFAIAQMFTAQGAKVAISDRVAPDESAAKIGAASFACDVTDEAQVQNFISSTEEHLGPIDIFVANAGTGVPNGPEGSAVGAPNKAWDLCWQVNVMGAVYAARALIPTWQKRGSGRFIVTASSAGLLNEIRTTPYTVTKHAAVGLAESIAIAHKEDGIKVQCICPQYVRTPMTQGQRFAEQSRDGYLEPSDVAECLKAAIQADEFLVLPHPVVKKYMQYKAENYDGYIDGLVKLRGKLTREDFEMKI